MSTTHTAPTESPAAPLTRRIDVLLAHYGESHQNPINKAIHWLCVPTIMFSLFGLLYALPFPVPKSVWANWAVVAVAFSLVYYIRLSVPLFFALDTEGGIYSKHCSITITKF